MGWGVGGRVGVGSVVGLGSCLGDIVAENVLSIGREKSILTVSATACPYSTDMTGL
jgi:hypothetical protein